MIPNVIYMCDKTLTAIKMLSKNWKKLNPTVKIKLYDDELCKAFLLKEYGQLYLDIFNFIKDGPIKADFWRVCLLYRYGGIYCDADNEPLVSLEFMEDVDFVTCSSYNPQYTFNPNFIACGKDNKIMEQCIEWYLHRYQTKPYSYWDWSIMQCFADIIDLKVEEGIYHYQDMKIQIIREVAGFFHHDAHNMYKGVRVFNNRYANWDPVTHRYQFNPVNTKLVYLFVILLIFFSYWISCHVI